MTEVQEFNLRPDNRAVDREEFDKNVLPPPLHYVIEVALISLEQHFINMQTQTLVLASKHFSDFFFLNYFTDQGEGDYVHEIHR